MRADISADADNRANISAHLTQTICQSRKIPSSKRALRLACPLLGLLGSVTKALLNTNSSDIVKVEKSTPQVTIATRA